MRTHLAAIVFAVSGTANVLAQPVEPQVPAPTFPTEIEQVVVDVVVTDKKGQPIAGLTLDDLIVTEDGQRQMVESFEAIELPVAPAPMAPAPPPISVNTTPEAQRGRTFVVVFDDTNITPFRARDAKAAVESFLVNGVREGDYVTLLSTSGDAWWTTRMNAGREKLLEVIQRLDGRYIPDHSRERMTDWEAMRIHVHRDRSAAGRVYQRFARYGIVQDRGGATDSTALSIQSDDPYVAARASEVYYDSVSRNRTTLNTLERALNALAGGQGRKSLILVSEGFIYDPDSPEFKKVNDASRRANTAIYFVNASGLEGMSADLTSHYGPALAQQDMGFVFYELQEAAAGAESIASDSGGFIVRNTNDLDTGIQRIADETRVYYLLGYTPTNRAHDGSFRRIEVKLRDGKGLKVRARKGYYAPTADGKIVADAPPGVDPAFQAALDSPWAEDAIPLRMTHYVGAETTPGKASVLVVTEVDIRDLALQAVGDRSVGAIEFLLVITHRESGEFFRYDQKIDMNMLPATRERLSRRLVSDRARRRAPARRPPGQDRRARGLHGTGRLGRSRVRGAPAGGVPGVHPHHQRSLPPEGRGPGRGAPGPGPPRVRPGDGPDVPVRRLRRGPGRERHAPGPPGLPGAPVRRGGLRRRGGDHHQAHLARGPHAPRGLPSPGCLPRGLRDPPPLP